MQLNGSQILIRSLIDQGVDMLFGFPGGSVLHLYDALYENQDEITHIVTSHEQGAAHAADGYARSTGRTGVVMATSGPGATNLVTGIATAFHDSVPMVIVTGNVGRDLIGRDSFQEVDIVAVTNPITKHNYFVQDAGDIAKTVREAFVIANSGRKGPVLIDIPKDILAQMAEYEPLPRFEKRPDPVPDETQIKKAVQAIQESKRPVIYCGGGVTFNNHAEKLRAFAAHIDAPVCLSMMGLTCMSADDRLNLGLVGMHGSVTANMAASECDVLIAVGARFSDRVAGNRQGFAKDATVIHIDIDKGEISKNVTADIYMVGDAGDCMDRLMAQLPELKHSDWLHRVLREKAMNALPDPWSEGDEINPREVVTAIGSVAPEDTIIVTDVGQHQMFVAQYYPFRKPRTFLSSSGLGTMGYGMGAANGAAFANPGKPVVMVTGDGSFHMNLSEMAVAVSHNLPIVIVVINNGVLGMVHQWQKLFYEARYSCTEINRKTDFVAVAKAFGLQGMRIEKSGDIRDVLKKAMNCGGPCLVECRVDHRERVFPIIPPGAGQEDMIFETVEEGR